MKDELQNKRYKHFLFFFFLGLTLHAQKPLDGTNRIIELEKYVTTGTRTERIISEAPVKTEHPETLQTR